MAIGMTADVLENGLQVAELRENGELVGVIRGCIKLAGTKFGGTHVNLGCILGLRVSPRHRYVLSQPFLFLYNLNVESLLSFVHHMSRAKPFIIFL